MNDVANHPCSDCGLIYNLQPTFLLPLSLTCLQRANLPSTDVRTLLYHSCLSHHKPIYWHSLLFLFLRLCSPWVTPESRAPPLAALVKTVLGITEAEAYCQLITLLTHRQVQKNVQNSNFLLQSQQRLPCSELRPHPAFVLISQGHPRLRPLPGPRGVPPFRSASNSPPPLVFQIPLLLLSDLLPLPALGLHCRSFKSICFSVFFPPGRMVLLSFPWRNPVDKRPLSVILA